jgi:hypothetical protein
MLALALAANVRGQSDIPALVEQAARPEVLFGPPSVLDSMLTAITAGGGSSVGALLDLAATPWAWQFEIIRLALERQPDLSRGAILKRLAGYKPDDGTISSLLVLFEKLGRPGDEAVLAAYLRADSRALAVPALRCVAAFGEGQSAIKLAKPLLSSPDQQIRLTAVWTVGELQRRGSGKLPRSVVHSLEKLTGGQSPQISLSAAEVLKAAGKGNGPGVVRAEDK